MDSKQGQTFPQQKSFDMTVTRAMQRASLTKQKLPVHEGVKLICDQCKYAATTRSHFTEHKKVQHEGSHFIVTSVLISHLVGVCLLGMLSLYIKE